MTRLAAVIAVAPLAVVGAQPAHAADTVECGPTASVFAVNSAGTLYRYPLNSPGSGAATWGAETAIDTGWNAYGRVLGGPDGRIYGINSTGLYRFRWTGRAWETIANDERMHLSSSFTGYTSAALRHKITVDERGDFYLVDALGKLRWYRYDESARQWTISGRVIDTGWGQYDLIVAAGPGVLYSRTPAGELFRHRFEPVSQRWIVQDSRVGASWNGHSRGVVSAGGDTLFGIQPDGDFFQYRYREDNNTWPVVALDIDDGWQGFTNVLATTNTCHLTVSHTPARPDTPIAEFSPTAVIQVPPAPGAAVGTVDYLYADNSGQLQHGRQSDPENFSAVNWSVISDGEAFTGKPAVVANGSGVVQAFAHKIDSDVWSRTQVAPPDPGWRPALELGGMMKSAPAVARLSLNTLAFFAFDADGALWHRPQDGPTGDLLPWRALGPGTTGAPAMTGDPLVVALADRSAQLFATDRNGTLHTATYRDGGIWTDRDETLTQWTSLGGAGFTGTPSAVVMPGPMIRIVMRSDTGAIVTQQQSSEGVFPGVWEPVGVPIAVAGSPAAILDPVMGRIVVVARGTDNEVYRNLETAQGSRQWGAWVRISPEVSDPAATDPTVAPYRNSTGDSSMIVFRNADDVTRIYDRRLVVTAPDRQAQADVRFVGHSLPAPPAAKAK